MYVPTKEKFTTKYILATNGTASPTLASEIYNRCLKKKRLTAKMLEAVKDFRDFDVSTVMSRTCLPWDRVKELNVGDPIYFTATDPIMRGIGKFEVILKGSDGTPAINYTANGLWLMKMHLRTAAYAWIASED